MASAGFHFHGSLNDFFPALRRNREIVYYFEEPPALKHAIETLGVPHPEVRFVLVNQLPAGFYDPVLDGSIVHIYPSEESRFPVAWSVMPPVPEPRTFVVDVHLRKLAKGLRLFGFDSLYANDYTDQMIAKLSVSEQRIILTRDRDLLKLKAVEYGYWIRSHDPFEQLTDVIKKYGLADSFHLFKRCVECNGKIETVAKEEVWDRLEPKTKLYYDDFYRCTSCGRIYWKGSHYQRLDDFIQRVKVVSDAE